jgi:hypothetical protein
VRASADEVIISVKVSNVPESDNGAHHAKQKPGIIVQALTLSSVIAS